MEQVESIKPIVANPTFTPPQGTESAPGVTPGKRVFWRGSFLNCNSWSMTFGDMDFPTFVAPVPPDGAFGKEPDANPIQSIESRQKYPGAIAEISDQQLERINYYSNLRHLRYQAQNALWCSSDLWHWIQVAQAMIEQGQKYAPSTPREREICSMLPASPDNLKRLIRDWHARDIGGLHRPIPSDVAYASFTYIVELPPSVSSMEPGARSLWRPPGSTWQDCTTLPRPLVMPTEIQINAYEEHLNARRDDLKRAWFWHKRHGQEGAGHLAGPEEFSPWEGGPDGRGGYDSLVKHWRKLLAEDKAKAAEAMKK